MKNFGFKIKILKHKHTCFGHHCHKLRNNGPLLQFPKIFLFSLLVSLCSLFLLPWQPPPTLTIPLTKKKSDSKPIPLHTYVSTDPPKLIYVVWNEPYQALFELECIWMAHRNSRDLGTCLISFGYTIWSNCTPNHSLYTSSPVISINKGHFRPQFHTKSKNTIKALRSFLHLVSPILVNEKSIQVLI